MDVIGKKYRDRYVENSIYDYDYNVTYVRTWRDSGNSSYYVWKLSSSMADGNSLLRSRELLCFDQRIFAGTLQCS